MGQTTRTIRSYELFEIQWEGATWTGYESAAEAQAVIDSPRTTRPGKVVRRVFEHDVTGLEHVYRPGFAERVEVVA